MARNPGSCNRGKLECIGVDPARCGHDHCGNFALETGNYEEIEDSPVILKTLKVGKKNTTFFSLTGLMAPSLEYQTSRVLQERRQ